MVMLAMPINDIIAINDCNLESTLSLQWIYADLRSKSKLQGFQVRDPRKLLGQLTSCLRDEGVRATYQPAIIGAPLFMRIKRRLHVLVGLLLVVAALTLYVQLRKYAPPEAARPLPYAYSFDCTFRKWTRRHGDG